jgi:AcrR family transcriptional regulator
LNQAIDGSRRVPGQETRERLLDVAEELFAEHGAEAVSLRRINSEAGLNPAAVHYHFGSRDGLVEAVVLRRMHELNERRHELLARVETGRWPLDVRHLVRILVQPLAELLATGPDEGRRYLAVLSGLYQTRTGSVHALASRYFGASLGRWVELLAELRPDLPRPVLLARVDLAARTLLSGLSAPPASAPRPRALRSDARVEVLIDFLTGALSAPASDPPDDGETT